MYAFNIFVVNVFVVLLVTHSTWTQVCHTFSSAKPPSQLLMGLVCSPVTSHWKTFAVLCVKNSFRPSAAEAGEDVALIAAAKTGGYQRNVVVVSKLPTAVPLSMMFPLLKISQFLLLRLPQLFFGGVRAF